ncbi:MAG: hypothetical protein ACXAC2_05825 [Candidatus Kariarchaeaceae archaeon]|jgi:hypothetical protein
MKKIKMEKYRPYRTMGTTCETREIKDKKVVWPHFDKILFNGKYRLRILKKADVKEAAELWKMCYPELFGSSHKYAWVLDPDQYENKIPFQENWEETKASKDHCMSALEDLKEKKLVSLSMITKDDQNLQIEYSLGCIHHDYREGKRGAGLRYIAFEHLKKIEDESNAEYLTAFCETWHSITQYVCFKHWGWKIAGIFPGQVTRWASGNKGYRGCTVHFYKFVGDAEKYVTKPEEWELIPEVRKIFEVMEEVNQDADSSAYEDYIENVYSEQ